MPPSLRKPFLLALCALALGCASQKIPDPKVTAHAYARAVQSGDADAVYALLTPEGQRTLGAAGTKQLVRESKQEEVEDGIRIPPEDFSLGLRLLDDVDRFSCGCWKPCERDHSIAPQGRPKILHDGPVVGGHE